jgi:hypothetical protein
VTEPSADAHPFRVAWETRDLDVLASRFADDIELRSPLLAAPFRGRAAATEVYGAVFEALGAITWVAETATETGRIFQWSAESGGRRFDGIDVLEIDGDGRITAITVFIRPLAGLGAFAAAAGPAMARRRGRARALALRVLGPVLRGFTWMADRTAARMVRP